MKRMREHEIAVDRYRKIHDRSKFEDHDPRRALERRDFRMLNEDYTAMANLPRTAQNHEYPYRHDRFVHPMLDMVFFSDIPAKD